jgi:hypothetical protein
MGLPARSIPPPGPAVSTLELYDYHANDPVRMGELFGSATGTSSGRDYETSDFENSSGNKIFFGKKIHSGRSATDATLSHDPQRKSDAREPKNETKRRLRRA